MPDESLTFLQFFRLLTLFRNGNSPFPGVCHEQFLLIYSKGFTASHPNFESLGLTAVSYEYD